MIVTSSPFLGPLRLRRSLARSCAARFARPNKRTCSQERKQLPRKKRKARWEDGNILLWPKASDKKTQTTSKTFLEKRVSMELITMTLLWTLEISIQNKKKNITYEIIMQENQISHVFRNFPVYGTTLTEEYIASCSRTFRKHKNPEEERKFIENGTPKSKTSLWKYCLCATLGHCWSQSYYWVTELLADYIGERTNLILWRAVTSVYLIIDHSIGQCAYESFNLNLFFTTGSDKNWTTFRLAP